MLTTGIRRGESSACAGSRAGGCDRRSLPPWPRRSLPTRAGPITMKVLIFYPRRTGNVNANPHVPSVNETASEGLSPETVERIRAALRKSPNQMTLQLARDLGVPEAEVIRCFPDGRAVELDITRWEEILRALEGLGTV